MSGPSRLSSLLVRDGLIGVKRMEQAFQRQVIYGGSLDTILLEMGAIGEDRLSEYLSTASGLPPAERELLEWFDPRAVQVCPRELAEEFRVAPVTFDGDALRVLVTDPVDLTALEGLATRIGAPIQPFVVPEFRFVLLVERLFGIPTPSRFLTLAAKIAAAQRPPPVEAKVIVEDAETRRVTESRTRTGPMTVDTLHEREHQRKPTAGHHEQAEAPISVAQMHRGEPSAPVEPVPHESTPNLRPTTPVPITVSPSESGPVPVTAADSGGVVRAPWRGGQTLEPEPLEPAAASAVLAAAEDRDAIFNALVRGVRSRSRYVALLVVQGEIAYGRMAVDGDETDPSVVQVALNLGATPALAQVVSTASPYIGPVNTGTEVGDAALAKLGGVVPPSALLLPVAIRDRVIAVAYAHRGADAISIAEVAEILPLAGDAGIALSKLILKAKALGYRKAAQEAPPPPVPAEDVPVKRDRDKGGWSRAPAEAVPHVALDFHDSGVGPEMAVTAPVALTAEAKIPTWAPIAHVIDKIELGGEAAPAALDDAVRRPEEAIEALRGRLPGRLWVDRYAVGARPTRASQHGSLLALAVRLGERSVQLFTDLMLSDNREYRYYGTLACAEVRSGKLIQPLVARLFDQDFGVRAAAIDALVGYPARDLDSALEVVRTALHSDAGRARAAAHALGALRDVGAIPDLIQATDRDHTTAEEARRALVLLTKQDFGTKTRKWRGWWEKNHERARIEWMLDGLAHPDDDVRLSASEELKRLTGEYFGYHYDLPKREREEARLKWVKWWDETGRRRFLREVDETSRPTAVVPILKR